MQECNDEIDEVNIIESRIFLNLLKQLNVPHLWKVFRCNFCKLELCFVSMGVSNNAPKGHNF